MAYHRKPNFNKDLIIGKKGEAWVYERLASSEKAVGVRNVAEDRRFMLLDVDFIQFLRNKENGEPYTEDDVFNGLMDKDADHSYYIMYEVKTDTVSLGSRNVVYELISHDGPGCAALSRAKYFFYIFTDDSTEIREVWLIDMKMWRQYIRENIDIGNIVKMTETRNGGVAFNNFNKHGDRVLNILTNIEIMEKEKIAKKIWKHA
jgi:hypothetical protein